MNLKPQIIEVHLNSNKYQAPIVINQYNRNIPFVFEVFNQDGTPAVINSNDIIKIEMALGNIAIIKSTGFTIEGNKVSWALDREISLNSGNGTFNFIIEDSNNTRVSSSKIDIKIESNSLDENTVPSPLKVTVTEELNKAITKATEVKNETENLIITGNAATKGEVAEANTRIDAIEQDYVSRNTFNSFKEATNATLSDNQNSIDEINSKIEEGFLYSKNINGYTKLPNGLIIQWGNVDVNLSNAVDTTVTVTYPIPFPNTALNVIVSEKNNNRTPPGRYGTAGAILNAKTTFELAVCDAWNTAHTGVVRTHWLAIGY